MLADLPLLARFGAIRCQPVTNRWNPFRQAKRQAFWVTIRIVISIRAGYGCCNVVRPGGEFLVCLAIVRSGHQTRHRRRIISEGMPRLGEAVTALRCALKDVR